MLWFFVSVCLDFLIVEWRNYYKPGESLDDFLVSLCELAKTCNFCSDGCMQKSIWDQIVEGLLDGDTIEDLLKECELNLDAAISKCRAKEAARQQREEITNIPSENTLVQAVQKASKNETQRPPSAMCPGCGLGHHQGGCPNCPAYHAIYHNCKESGHFARVCCSRLQQLPGTPLSLPSATPNASTVSLEPHVFSATIKPAPTVEIQISSLNGHATVSVLPDSGAEISIAGYGLLQSLNKHPDNLLMSPISPQAVNGSAMQPLGKLPVKLKLEDCRIIEDFTFMLKCQLL